MPYESLPVCDLCWHFLEGPREAARVVGDRRVWEACWRCNVTHKSGIYMRAFVSEEGTVQLPNG